MMKYILILAAACCVYLPLITAHNLWVDELFTLRMIQGSFTDIIRDTVAQDTHTPFYYLLLKSTTLVLSGIEAIPVGRLYSLFWLFMTALLGIFPIRRLFGDKTATVFVCLILFMPVSLFIALDIRMYSQALFFMTGTAVYAGAALYPTKKTDRLFLALMTAGALYTHLYTTMGVGAVYAVTGFHLMQKYHSFGRGFMWFWGIVTANALIFAPWLYFGFYHQTAAVYDIWWPTNEMIATVFSFFIRPLVWIRLPLWNEVLLAFLMITLWGGVGYGLIYRKKLFPDDKGAFFTLLPGVLFFVLTTALLVSFIFRPILTWRYVIPFFGLIYLAAALILSRNVFLRRVVIFAVFGVFLIAYPRQLTRLRDSAYDTMAEKLKNNPENTLFATPKSDVYMLMRFLLPDRPLIQLYINPEQVFFNDSAERTELINRFQAGTYSSVIVISNTDQCPAPIKSLYYPNARYCLFRLSPELFQRMLEMQINHNGQP